MTTLADDKMADSCVVIAAAAAIVSSLSEIDYFERYAKPKRTHKVWVRPWILDRGIEQQCNTAYKLQRQLADCDVTEFGKMLRMPPDCFQFVLERIRPLIQRHDTNYRTSISSEERLSLTFKFLATGESPTSLATAYRVGRCTVGRVIKDTCAAIYDELGGEFIKTPSTRAEWEDVMGQFKHRWNYPACLGAIDGKHVRIIRPWNTGSSFFNYKDFFSILMIAVVNANYEYIYVDVGSEGKVADGGAWKRTHLHHAIEHGELDLPPAILLEGIDTPVTPHFVADNAFSITPRLLKPYSKRNRDDREAVFDYRLSRARRIVENVFGVTASRFRVLTSAIYMNPDSVCQVLLAITTLHNLLRQRSGAAYMPPGTVDTEDINYAVMEGTWRKSLGGPLEPLEPVTTIRNATTCAKNLREAMADYFISDAGMVPWQWRHIHNTQDNLLANLNTV